MAPRELLKGRWTVTWNNYPEGWEEKLRDLSLITYLVAGRETGAAGTPHLQMYLEVSPRQRFSALKARLAEAGAVGVHLEAAKAGAAKNREYCTKEDEEFVEWGQARQQGKRSDLRDLCEAAQKRGASFYSMALAHPAAHARAHQWASMIAGEASRKRARKAKKKSRRGQHRYPWQKKVSRLLQRQNNREVLWVWSTGGDLGKSWLGTWLQLRGAFLVTTGKWSDIAHAYGNAGMPNVVVLDLARSYEETVPYALLENWKDGRLFAPKYNSRVLEFEPARVVVFANFLPDRSKMSEDRWKVIEICEPGNGDVVLVET